MLVVTHIDSDLIDSDRTDAVTADSLQAAPALCRYVLCNSCKSPDTLLDRDSATRIMFLRCQQCGASRTVAPIKAGFVARTSRRKVTGP